jgi:type II secretory pathway predicted ATPase ExeA
VYEKFFSLAHRPFAAAPNLECIVAHQGYVDAREKLMRCLTDGCGTAILTAPAGLGKSLLCQDIQSRLRGLFTVAYLCSAQFPNRKAMLQAILFELGTEYLGLSEDEARLGIVKAAQDAANRGRSLIVIVDEAHLTSTELLQELRGLAEPSPRCAIPVRLMLAGQLELEERLADQELDSLNQRIACHAILESLTQSESAEYILERLAIAGAKTQTFTEEALAFIVKAADGNPRAIHQLCDHCLLSAYTIEEKPISLEIARNSLDDLRALPLHWNDAGLLDDAPDANDDSLDDASDDEFVSTAGSEFSGEIDDKVAFETTSEDESHDPGPLWSDSPNFGVIEVGGAMETAAEAPEVVESVDSNPEIDSQLDQVHEPMLTEAALFASIAPWPAVPVEAVSDPFGDSMATEIVELESIPFSMTSSEVDAVESAINENLESADSELEPAAESRIDEPELESSPTTGHDDGGFTLRDPELLRPEPEERDESEEDTAIEKVWTHRLELIDDLEPDDFEDEEIIINDHYAALDRASQALSSYLPQAPELLQFLSQYSVSHEPRRQHEVATSMHQSAVEIAEPEVDTTEEELLSTIRGLQEQLRQATVERPRPQQEPWQASLDPVYDVIEPPEENIVLPPISTPTYEHSIPEQPSVAEAPIAKPAEPVKSRFAQLFSRMRQRRREVEDRLRKNADWI